jgi:hypothetical protein
MQLSIQGLKDMGAFTGAPVEREIKWSQGGVELVGTVFVRPLSYKTTVGDLLARRDNGDAVAGRIASSICAENGDPVFTVDDITGDADPERGALDGNLTMALLSVIGEVNGLGKAKS